MKFVDIHTHTNQDLEDTRIVDLSEEQEIEIGINTYYSMGIHPWFIESSKLDKELKKIDTHIEVGSFFAIGECGLDKACNTDFKLQLIAFEKQIALSEKYQKPLVLHIVKAFNDLIRLRLESNAKQVWIVHGFNGSPQLAKQLSNLGIYISFGFYLGKSISKASKSIAAIPLSHIFHETDASGLSIKEIYSLASERLNISVAQLKSQFWLNFQEVFL